MSAAAGLAATLGASAVLLLLPVFWARVCLSVKLLVLGYLVFGAFAIVAFRPGSTTAQGPNVGPITYFQTLNSWYVIGTFAAIGAAIFLGASMATIVSPSGAAELASAPNRTELRLQLPPSALWFSVLCVAFYVLGLGPSYVLISPRYLAHYGPTSLLSVSTALIPLAIIVASNVMFASRSTRGTKGAAFAILLLVELVQLGQASRSFGLFFVFALAGGWLTGRWDTKQAASRAFLATALSIATLGIPLRLRAEPSHGLIPALGYLISDPSSFFSGNANPFSNVLLGAPLAFYVANREPAIGTHALWTSINPLPGSLTDWSRISPTLRLNSFEPYGAVGELLNYGWLVVIIHFAIIGSIFELLTRFARRQPGQLAPAMTGLIAGVGGLLLVRSTQYNLRAEIRLVYYVVAGVIIAASLARTLHRRTPTTRSRGDWRPDEVTSASQLRAGLPPENHDDARRGAGRTSRR